MGLDWPISSLFFRSFLTGNAMGSCTNLLGLVWAASRVVNGIDLGGSND
jgi:hypothetical protein